MPPGRCGPVGDAANGGTLGPQQPDSPAGLLFPAGPPDGQSRRLTMGINVTAGVGASWRDTKFSVPLPLRESPPTPALARDPGTPHVPAPAGGAAILRPEPGLAMPVQAGWLIGPHPLSLAPLGTQLRGRLPGALRLAAPGATLHCKRGGSHLPRGARAPQSSFTSHGRPFRQHGWHRREQPAARSAPAPRPRSAHPPPPSPPTPARTRPPAPGSGSSASLNGFSKEPFKHVTTAY